MTTLDRLYSADQRFPLEVGPGHIFDVALADRETLNQLIAVAQAALDLCAESHPDDMPLELSAALAPLIADDTVEPTDQERPKTLAEAAQDFNDALSEAGRLIREEFERTAKQINDIWQRRNK